MYIDTKLNDKACKLPFKLQAPNRIRNILVSKFHFSKIKVKPKPRKKEKEKDPNPEKESFHFRQNLVRN